MKELILSVVLIFTYFQVHSQTDSTNSQKNPVVEESAYPINGFPEFYKWFNENAKYPKLARKNNIEGRVIVKMLIDTDGNMKNFEIVKSLGGGCDEETIRVLNLENAPKWISGKQDGRPVKMNISMPFVFKLR